MVVRTRSLLIFFSLILIVALNVSLFVMMQRFQARKPDFASLYQAGRALIHERFPGLVDKFPELNGPNYAVMTSDGMFAHDTMHPPYELAIFAALALMKFRIAYPVWWACNLALLFIATRLLWRYVPRLQDKYPYLLIAVATFFPVFIALVQGQTSVLLLVLLALCHDSLQKRHEFRAGFFLAMGMFKFVLVIPMVFLMALERRWKALAGFTAGCLGLFLVACSLVGFDGVVAYGRQIAGYGKAAPEQAGTESLMPNLRGLLHVFVSPVAPSVILTVLTLVLTLALLLWVDSRILRCPNLSLRFSAQVLLSVLISYHLFPHDASILILPLMLLLNHVLNEEIGIQYRRAVIVCVTVIYLLPLIAGIRVGMPVIGLMILVLLALEHREFVSNPAPVVVN